MDPIRAVKGMNDILPDEMPRWHAVEATFRRVTARYGFGEVRPPIVEPTALFVRGIGDTTDIVEKEMYTFVDKGEHSLTLRPEGTASCVRTYIQHKIATLEPVSKWMYMGPMYRRERPAKGRYRQFYQLGAEIYGAEGPHVDAELIEMLVTFLDEMGIEDIEVLVNSLGGPETREKYRDALIAYLTPQKDKLSEDSQRRLERNPLRVLDSKAEQDKAISQGAPSILEFLSDEDRAHFEGLQELLTAFGTKFTVEPTLVRGLDYYTRTLFEVKGRGGQLGAQDTICGGGRYDGLVQALGGPATPAVGFAIGVERLLMTQKAASSTSHIDAFVLAPSAGLRTEAALVTTELRRAGLRVDNDLRGNSLKSQMRRADKLGANLAIIVGEAELERGAVLLRDLETKAQEEVPRAQLVETLKTRLAERTKATP